MNNSFKTVLAAALLATSLSSIAEAANTKAGDWVVRGRVIGVIPDEDATVTGAVTGNSINIDNSVVPEVDISYFFTKNIAAELIAATAPHDVHAQTSAGYLDLGSAWVLPPTLTLQYHFTEMGKCKPYIGAGINYTIFWNEDTDGSSITDIDYDSSFGGALQAGVDYMIDDRWMVNFDVKRIWINSDVSINSGAVNADVDINPWVVGLGIGYKF